jgi:hypothetical protein
MHRARAARARRFDSLPSLSDEACFIPQKKAKVSKRQYSSKANGSNVRDFAAAKNTVLNLDIDEADSTRSVPADFWHLRHGSVWEDQSGASSTSFKWRFFNQHVEIAGPEAEVDGTAMPAEV